MTEYNPEKYRSERKARRRQDRIRRFRNRFYCLAGAFCLGYVLAWIIEGVYHVVK